MRHCSAGPQRCQRPLARPVDRYHLIPAGPGALRLLRPVQSLCSAPGPELWIEREVSQASFRRTDCRGLITALAHWRGRQVAIVWNDFRVEAGSFGHANARRFAAFLNHLAGMPGRVPLIYVVSSAGVSMMEGRSAFAHAFALWPALRRYAKDHLVMTCATGRCLGLAPLLFGLGHYRVAVAGATQLNLTGPEVLRAFFGASIDFDQCASAERGIGRNDLVHELVPSVEAAMDQFAALLASPPVGAWPADLGPATRALLASFLDGPPREVMAGRCARVRLFLGVRRGIRLGVFVNPLERSDNLVTVRTLAKYSAGLDLMQALRLPIVSCLDSPGVDPRFEQSDANNIRTMLQVGGQVISYPHGMMGVVTRRCFGGASTLSFPKVFGGTRAVALRGATIGMMHDRIVGKLLAGSPRLLAQWQAVAARQGQELEDLLADGTLDAVVRADQLAGEVDRFIAAVRKPRLHRTRRSTGVPVLALRRVGPRLVPPEQAR